MGWVYWLFIYFELHSFLVVYLIFALLNRKHQEFEAKLIEQFLQQLYERASSSDNKEVMAEYQTLQQCYDKMRSSNERSKRQQGSGQERGEVDELSAGWEPEPQIVPSAKPAPSNSATQQLPNSNRQNAAAAPARASNSVSSGGSNGSRANQSSSTAAQSTNSSSRYEFIKYT